MRILVTGATGRLGSRLVPRLLHLGESVRILAREPARAASLARAGAEVLVGDLMYAEDRGRALQDVDSVIHLAATFRTQDTAAIKAVNEHGTVALGQAAMQAGLVRFVFVSTGLIYGLGRGRPAKEDDAPRPDPGAAYPVSKVAAERSLFDLHSQAGLPLVVLRLAFVYGEGDPHLGESMMWARQWPAHKRLHMVHHEDVAQALRLALAPTTPTGRIFNVGDDAPVTTWELHRLNNEQMPSELAEMPLHDPWEGIMDTERIRTELGFRPMYRTVHAASDAGAL